MSDVINGKVAAIIDDSTLVLNVGLEHGVSEGMAFAVFAEYQEILDPDSGASLGKWEMVKARVVVTHVQERMCTASAPLVAAEESSARTLSSMMVEHSFGRYGQRDEEREHLDVRTVDISGQPRMQPIAVGDGARFLALEVDAGQETAAEVESRDEVDTGQETVAEGENKDEVDAGQETVAEGENKDEAAV